MGNSGESGWFSADEGLAAAAKNACARTRQNQNGG